MLVVVRLLVARAACVGARIVREAKAFPFAPAGCLPACRAGPTPPCPAQTQSPALPGTRPCSCLPARVGAVRERASRTARQRQILLAARTSSRLSDRISSPLFSCFMMMNSRLVSGSSTLVTCTDQFRAGVGKGGVSGWSGAADSHLPMPTHSVTRLHTLPARRASVLPRPRSAEYWAQRGADRVPARPARQHSATEIRHAPGRPGTATPPPLA